ncbi:MAG: ribosomal protein L7/L12 [Anaerolineales bacterium]|nr:ribosomal protein L7/L12 [Chloroflexota bacterium]MBL6981424.1 ribosomal protein L7/L12 [Anaerolineales bacterium]
MTFEANFILKEKYRIERPIAQGAFGDVYLATHLDLNVPRALKVLRLDAPGVGSTIAADVEMRFRLEAQLGAKIRDNHVIQVFDFEKDNELLILVMEYAPGGSLLDKIQKNQDQNQNLAIDEGIRLLQDVAKGLSVLHANDLIHRDLKPNNILFDDKGVAKVADLGLAQIPHGPSMRSQLSTAMSHPGTPAYMSPEQEATFGYLTPASDVYALGVVVFEAITGKNYKLLRPGTRGVSLKTDVPEWLDDLLLKMLAKDVDSRPWNGTELLEKISQGIGEKGASIDLLPEPIISEAQDEVVKESLSSDAWAIQDVYDVIIKDAGNKKIQVIKIIRQLTSLGLADSKELAETSGATILKGVSAEEANEAKMKLESAGALIELIEYRIEIPLTGLFDVDILNAGSKKIQVIKVIRQLTNLGLADSKELAETPGASILIEVSAKVANDAKSKLEAAGALIAINESGIENLVSRLFIVDIVDAGPKKIQVIKVIRQLTNLGLADSKELAETPGASILIGVSAEVANDAKNKLEEAGAVIALKEIG